MSRFLPTMDKDRLCDSAVSGEPLVLLPGMNCTPDLWTGCGLVGAITPALAETTVDRQVDRLLDSLPRRFALVGFSLGGVVAMSLCRRAPERVARLCLMSTNAKAPTPAQRAGWQSWRDRLAAAETPYSLQQGILSALSSEPARLWDPDIADRLLRMADHIGAGQLDAQLQMQESRIDESRTLGLLRMPVLLISGTADVICPPVFHQAIAAIIPGAQLASVRAGHVVPMERPGEVGRLIKQWAR